MAVRRRNASNEIFLLDALKDLCKEKEIPPEAMFSAIETALAFACKKTSDIDKNIKVDIDREKGTFRITELRDVVKKVTHPQREISLDDARRINPEYKIGDVVSKEIPTEKFGRIAAQAAKQVVMQKIREAERILVYDEYTDHANDIVNGTVLRIENGDLILDIGKTEAILTAEEMMPQDNFEVGDRVKAYVAEVRKGGKGPQVYVSRTHPGFLRRIFEKDVPEIQEGIITVKSVAREGGVRAKIAVASKNPNIDAIGSCVGQHGIRIQNLASEIGEEKIDVILWDEDPAIYIANSLSPSKVMKIAVNELDKIARVVVPNNQLSLAIGKGGLNTRLAARLTGWKIDIKSKSQAEGDVWDSDYRVAEIKGTKFFSSLVKPKQPNRNPKKKFNKNKFEVQDTDTAITNAEISDTEVVNAEIAKVEVADNEVVNSENSNVEITDTKVAGVENSNVEV